MAIVGVGSIVAAPLISGVGIRTALIVTGAFLPILAALTWRRLLTVDRSAAIPTDQLAALQSVPMLAHLSLVTKEEIASRLAPITVEPDEEVIREGDPGDRFYILVTGEVDVSSSGQSIVTRSAPDYFGEIALLRDVPRTATVRARTPLTLFALEREDFLAAVTEHAAGRAASHAVIDERLATASSP
jgi:CRP-like cAMP-binding protein